MTAIINLNQFWPEFSSNLRDSDAKHNLISNPPSGCLFYITVKLIIMVQPLGHVGGGGADGGRGAHRFTSEIINKRDDRTVQLICDLCISFLR